ncbi:hypothetical protein [Nocardia sp. NPDC050710]|uniref:antitoxin VbhA family protein n=1 Tax=Nocardia sp. NPDC050710 TaxID=3157220 RepID=UPI0034047EA9
MSQPVSISVEFADLFRGVVPRVREAVEQILASQRLEGLTLTREIVADTLGYATGELSEAEYDRRAARWTVTEHG